MVGGDEDAFNACRPVFEAMGKNIVYEGKAGAGQHVKMANQIVVAANTTGVCEAVSYCLAMGIDPEIMLKTIETGAAASWQVSNNGPKMCSHDFAPGFFIKHFVKDMKIALEECKNKNIRLPILEKVCSLYTEMENENQGDLGTQAIIKKYTK
jgi:3-hydroxyisobutyrate dehydrogenase/2-hydroxy-3-oxopropionate reductase